MPTIAPWLNPPDFIRAMSAGANAGGEIAGRAQRQNLAMIELAARQQERQAERERYAEALAQKREEAAAEDARRAEAMGLAKDKDQRNYELELRRLTMANELGQNKLGLDRNKFEEMLGLSRDKMDASASLAEQRRAAAEELAKRRIAAQLLMKKADIEQRNAAAAARAMTPDFVERELWKKAEEAKADNADNWFEIPVLWNSGDKQKAADTAAELEAYRQRKVSRFGFTPDELQRSMMELSPGSGNEPAPVDEQVE